MKLTDLRPAAVAVIVAASGIVAGVIAGPAAAATGPSMYRFGEYGSHGKLASTRRRMPVEVKGIRGRIVQIATSNSASYALTRSGAVWAVGEPGEGQLGDGRTTGNPLGHAVRVSFPSGVKIRALATPMPFDAAIAIDTRGRAWGWGDDEAGDLCSTVARETRPALIGLGNVTLATGARDHSLFDSSGTVYACGSGAAGQLGTGGTQTTATPTPVVDLPGAPKITALNASWEGSGALLANGSYYDWGYNLAGQLGDSTSGPQADSDTPVEVKLPTPARVVSQGGSYADNGQTLAILRDDRTYAWGANLRGQVGDGSRKDADRPIPVAVPAGVHFVKIASGGSSSYAIDTRGRLWDWGNDRSGQLGLGGSSAIQDKPVMAGIRAIQVSSTASNVAVLEPR